MVRLHAGQLGASAHGAGQAESVCDLAVSPFQLSFVPAGANGDPGSPVCFTCPPDVQ